MTSPDEAVGVLETEMVEGYLDGFHDDRDALPDATNRGPCYNHGWLNGRDDRRREPRATASELRELADALLHPAQPEEET